MNNPIDKILKEYKEAFQENLDAGKQELQARDRKKKAHYVLLRISDQLRATTRELLEDTLTF